MKLARMRWSGEFAVELCKQTEKAFSIVRRDPVPSDARFIRAATDEHGYIWIVMESDLFAEVPEGMPIPELSATGFERVYDAR